MDNEDQNTHSLEKIKYIDDDIEFWSARELQVALGYSRWEGFCW